MGKEAFFLKHIFVWMDCIMAGQGILIGEEAGVVTIEAKLTRPRPRRIVAEVISWGRRGSQVNNDVPGDSQKAKVKVRQSEALSSIRNSGWRSLSRRSLLPQPGSLFQASCWARCRCQAPNRGRPTVCSGRVMGDKWVWLERRANPFNVFCMTEYLSK